MTYYIYIIVFLHLLSFNLYSNYENLIISSLNLITFLLSRDIHYINITLPIHLQIIELIFCVKYMNKSYPLLMIIQYSLFYFKGYSC